MLEPLNDDLKKELNKVGIISFRQLENWTYNEINQLLGNSQCANAVFQALLHHKKDIPTNEKPIKYECIEMKRLKCVICGPVDATRIVGYYYPEGMKSEANGVSFLEKHRNQAYFSHINALGTVESIPFKCPKCNKIGSKGWSFESFGVQFKSI